MKIVDYLYDRYLKYRYYKDNEKKNVIFAKSSFVSRDCKFEVFAMRHFPDSSFL